MPALNQLYEQYGRNVEFLAVYILEAHPTDVWQMASNVREGVVFASPRNMDERASLAGSCVRKLGIKFPAVLDDFSNVTEVAYTGWPDRIYLIDKAGKIVYKSQAGPFGFHPQELRAALEHLGAEQHAASGN